MAGNLSYSHQVAKPQRRNCVIHNDTDLALKLAMSFETKCLFAEDIDISTPLAERMQRQGLLKRRKGALSVWKLTKEGQITAELAAM